VSDDPYRHPGEPSGPRCPGCGGGLIREAIGKTLVLTCLGCRGAWLGAGEIADLMIEVDRQDAILALPARPAADAVERERACPTCGGAMRKQDLVRRAGVTVDACRHGVWFDAGELRAVVVHLRAHGDRRAATHDAREAAASLRTAKPRKVDLGDLDLRQQLAEPTPILDFLAHFAQVGASDIASKPRRGFWYWFFHGW
jgi:Zn-finger nucleic acid-binding protein